MELAVVVCTCKKYEQVAKRCIQCFERFWHECKYSKYVITDKNLELEGTSIQLSFPSVNSWGERVKKGLEKIEEEFVLMVLDDFIIEEPVDEVAFHSFLDQMNKNPQIAHILLNTVEDSKNLVYSSDLMQRDEFARYKTSLQLGIWRRQELKGFLEDSYSPWEFELFGNMKTFYSKKIFLCLAEKEIKPIKYNDGFFVVQGCVNKEEMLRLEDKLKIDLHNMQLPIVDTIVRDDIKLFPRIVRRIKIIVLYLYHKYFRKLRRHR